MCAGSGSISCITEQTNELFLYLDIRAYMFSLRQIKDLLCVQYALVYVLNMQRLSKLHFNVVDALTVIFMQWYSKNDQR